MMSEKRFWEIIERNKKNPEQFIKESEKLTLEEIFDFTLIFNKFIVDELSKHEEFIMGICYDYDLVPYEEMEDGRQLFTSQYDYAHSNIVFKGKDLYNAFMREDKKAVADILNQEGKEIIGNRDYGVMLVYETGMSKLSNGEDIGEKYNEYFDEFFIQLEKYAKENNLDNDILKSKSKYEAKNDWLFLDNHPEKSVYCPFCGKDISKNIFTIEGFGGVIECGVTCKDCNIDVYTYKIVSLND